MTIALPMTADAGRSPWRRHGIALALAAAVILLLFRGDIGDMAHVWWTSTTFGHCVFIGPIVAWLAWQRRDELARLTPVGWWPGLVLVAAGGFGWLLGDAASVAFARQLGLLLMLQGAVVTVLGPAVARGLLFPLCYAVFLIPFGEWLEPPLQGITVRIVMVLLHLIGIPAASDGVLIHAGRYYFEVAEACSGAKFVIAMTAFGVLVAHLCFASWRRRALFLGMSLTVSVLANGVRAFATIWVADLTSVEAATGFDHIVYGWVFFGLVMAAVLAVGWRWFDRAPDAIAFDPATIPATQKGILAMAPAMATVVAIALLFPLWSMAVGRPAPWPAQIGLPTIAGWERAPIGRTAPWQPSYPGADHRLFGRYADGHGHRVDVAVAAYAGQREGAELISASAGVIGPSSPWLRVADLPDIADGSAMRIRAPGPVDRIVVTWYRVGDTLTADPTMVKLATMRVRLLGGSQRAIAVHVSAEGAQAAEAIAAFLPALGPVDRFVDRLSDTGQRLRHPAAEQVRP